MMLMPVNFRKSVANQLAGDKEDFVIEWPDTEIGEFGGGVGFAKCIHTETSAEGGCKGKEIKKNRTGGKEVSESVEEMK
jgi:hypothetical protein